MILRDAKIDGAIIGGIAVFLQPVRRNGLTFAIPKPGEPLVEPKAQKKAKENAPPRAKQSCDPRLVAASRELRDRWLERVKDDPSLMASTMSSAAKYDVTRAIGSNDDQPTLGAPPTPIFLIAS